MKSRTVLAVTTLALAPAIASSALTLTSPVNGAFHKTPGFINYQAAGTQARSPATVTARWQYVSQTGWWYPYSGKSFTQYLNTAPPINTWITVELNDAGTLSQRSLFTAYPWSIPGSIAANATNYDYSNYNYSTGTASSFPKGYCTNFASRAFHAGPGIVGSYVPWNGHAKYWVSNAAVAGWQTTTQTTGGMIGAVVVWTNSGAGHVGIVNDMTKLSTGQVEYLIQEMNWGTVTDPVNYKTTNFGKVTPLVLRSSAMNRSASTTFVGFVLPKRR